MSAKSKKRGCDEVECFVAAHMILFAFVNFCGFFRFGLCGFDFVKVNFFGFKSVEAVSKDEYHDDNNQNPVAHAERCEKTGRDEKRTER